ncbi:MAG: ImmA/IrrE family metallo-endopeptidase [Pseudomonadota bacterium]
MGETAKLFNKDFNRCFDPVLTATSLIAALETPTFPLDIEQVALNVGIQGIQEIPDKNVEGILVALPDKSVGFISISKHIREKTRKRFTIAHELGHFLIKSHDSNYNCNAFDINNYSAKNKPQENEANQFAAELLMPRQYFSAEIDHQEPSYELFQSLTSKFESSLQSTLIRFKELTNESIAIVLSENSMIKWVSRSESFKYYIEADVPLSTDTYAIEFFKREELPQEFEEVDKNVWFDASIIKHQITVQELSLPLPYYNQVLSVIWLFEDEDELDEYDDFEDEFDGYLKLKDKS